MHARTLSKILRAALAAATGAGVAGCGACMFGGNPYGPYMETFLERVPAAYASALDQHGCAAVCGQNVASCARVEPPKPTTAKLACTCRFPGDDFSKRKQKWIDAPLDTPMDVEPSACKPCCDAGESQPMMVEQCSRDDSLAVHLDPGDALVVCRIQQPGGCTGFSGGGRPPRGLVAPARARDVAGFFARTAYFERASIAAFVELANALAAAGAPRALVSRARRSARDEARHARSMTAIARRRGGAVERPRVRATRAPSIADLARDNAIEGCVRETFGALLALHQATHARGAGVRAAMKRIARDEIRHAALSWDVHGFFAARLDDATRAEIRDAMRAAADDASRSDVPAHVRRAVGLPSDDEARAIVAALRASLWDAA